MAILNTELYEKNQDGLFSDQPDWIDNIFISVIILTIIGFIQTDWVEVFF